MDEKKKDILSDNDIADLLKPAEGRPTRRRRLAQRFHERGNTLEKELLEELATLESRLNKA